MAKKLYDRESAEDVLTVLRRLVGSDDRLRRVLKLFESDIRLAVEQRPDSWSVTLHPKGHHVRLLAGRILSVDIRKEGISLIEYDAEGASTLPRTTKIRIIGDRIGRFGVEANVIWRKHTLEEFDHLDEAAFDRHRTALKQVAQSQCPPRAYSPGVLDAINEFLGTDLPHRQIESAREDEDSGEGIVDIVRRRYPDWDGFEHPTFVQEEIEYKRKASRKARELLAEADLRRLLDAGDLDEVGNRIRQVARSTNLMFMSMPTSGDLRVLEREDVDKPTLFRCFVDLLYGEGDSPARLDRFVAEAFGPVNPYWTFPTYFLFFVHPETDLFVKPGAVSTYLSLHNLGDRFQRKPSGAAYQELLDIAATHFEELEPYGAEDMIDFQSVLWVAASVQSKPRYWKISPGTSGWQWPECKEKGFIAIGWNDLGDVGKLNQEEFEARVEEARKSNSDYTQFGARQLWKFVHEMKEGDGVVANNGQSEVLGVGRITGPAIHTEESEQRNVRPVEWIRTDSQATQEGGWNRTIIELSEEKYQRYLGATGAGTDPDPNAAFTEDTFRLLDEIHMEPTLDFYNANKEALREHVEQPFQQIFRSIAPTLPEEITGLLETEKRLFSRFPKNDYGRGGAWDFIWAAFYTKDRKRSTSMQLWAVLTRNELRFGFGFGEKSADEAKLFARNVRQRRGELARFLGESFEKSVLFGNDSDGSARTNSLAEWLNDPARFSYQIWRRIDRQTLLAQSAEETRKKIEQMFQALAPLVLFSLEENPSLGDGDESDEPNPDVTMEQVAAATGFGVDTVDRWTRAIRRKGQAIFYGPPGTGKTFVAEHLASHLIGGGRGFSRLVQFHPAYSYEDFIQGIRPQVDGNGNVVYETTSGHFLNACNEARSVKDPCVLIIDEINRANLARVFGELMYLLEYRDRTIPLAGGKTLHIPRNLFLIGTMNTADRSIALVDHALRRRFAFLVLQPVYSVLRDFQAQRGFRAEGLIGVLESLNSQIDDPNYSVGISFFMRDDLQKHLPDIWQMEIEPYFEEYFFDQLEKVDRFRWERIRERVLS